MGDHIFHPHGDAPGHHNPDYEDRGFEYWDLNYVFNKACLIDLSKSKDSAEIDGIRIHTKISDFHISPYNEQIKNCRAVIFRTGYDKWLEANRKHIPGLIPYFDNSAVEILSKFKNLRVIGTDSLTVDQIENNYAHRKFKNKFIIECLVNLYRIPQKHKNNFHLQTSPIAIVGASGGPVLAYAYIPIKKNRLLQYYV